MTLAITAREAATVSPSASRTPEARPPDDEHALDVGAGAQLAAVLAHDRGQRLDEPHAAAARHGHAAELDRARDDLRHEAGDAPAPGRGRCAAPRARAGRARARTRTSRSSQSRALTSALPAKASRPAPAEAAVRLAREIQPLRRPELGREHAEAVLGRGHELLELALPGGAVAGRVALELGDVVLERGRQEGGPAVREERRRSAGRC